MLSRISRSFRSIRRKLVLAGSVITLAMLTASPAMAVAPDAKWCKSGMIIICTTHETFQQAVNAAQAAHAPGYILADPGSFAENVTATGLKDVNFYGGPSSITGSFNITNSQNIGVFSLTVGGLSGLVVDHAKGDLYFDGNTAYLKIMNSTLKNPSGTALVVINHTGQIILEKVNASSSSQHGASLDNRAGSAGVTVTGSKFDKNVGSGLEILSDGLVHVSGVSASSNGEDGANIDNSTGTAGVAIDKFGTKKNKFDKNGGDGLFVRSDGQINVFATSASTNIDFGATLINDTGTANIFVGNSVDASKYDSNGSAGLFVQTAGGVVLRRLSASKNKQWGMTVLANDDIHVTDINVNKNGLVGANGGAILLNYTGTGNIVVQTDKSNMNHFDGNSGVSGLSILTHGTVALIDVSASKNKDAKGVNMGPSGEVLIGVKKSKWNHFDNNGHEGVVISSAGPTVTIKNSTAIKNGVGGVYDGIQVHTTANGSAVFTCGTYSKNTDNGIEALLGTGQLFLNGITMSANAGGNLNSTDLFPTNGVCPS